MMETGVAIIDVDSREDTSGSNTPAVSSQVCVPTIELMILLAVAQECTEMATDSHVFTDS